MKAQEWAAHEKRWARHLANYLGVQVVACGGKYYAVWRLSRCNGFRRADSVTWCDYGGPRAPVCRAHINHLEFRWPRTNDMLQRRSDSSDKCELTTTIAEMDDWVSWIGEFLIYRKAPPGDWRNKQLALPTDMDPVVPGYLEYVWTKRAARLYDSWGKAS